MFQLINFAKRLRIIVRQVKWRKMPSTWSSSWKIIRTMRFTRLWIKCHWIQIRIISQHIVKMDFTTSLMWVEFFSHKLFHFNLLPLLFLKISIHITKYHLHPAQVHTTLDPIFPVVYRLSDSMNLSTTSISSIRMTRIKTRDNSVGTPSSRSATMSSQIDCLQ